MAHSGLELSARFVWTCIKRALFSKFGSPRLVECQDSDNCEVLVELSQAALAGTFGNTFSFSRLQSSASGVRPATTGWLQHSRDRPRAAMSTHSDVATKVICQDAGNATIQAREGKNLVFQGEQVVNVDSSWREQGLPNRDLMLPWSAIVHCGGCPLQDLHMHAHRQCTLTCPTPSSVALFVGFRTQQTSRLWP
jgi:hypothetical protein